VWIFGGIGYVRGDREACEEVRRKGPIVKRKEVGNERTDCGGGAKVCGAECGAWSSWKNGV
jgi:hypothetical protein